jgi:hypothetical protein
MAWPIYDLLIAVRREVAPIECIRKIGGSADVVKRCSRSVLDGLSPPLTCAAGNGRGAKLGGKPKRRRFHPGAQATGRSDG